MLVSTEKGTIKSFTSGEGLSQIERLDHKLYEHFHAKFVLHSNLTRSLVSFQANKTRPAYRWYKYKEAFSAPLIEYLFHTYGITSGRVLDPFAGSGTALFVAASMGIAVEGIEVLPIGQQITTCRQLLESEFTMDDVATLE